MPSDERMTETIPPNHDARLRVIIISRVVRNPYVHLLSQGLAQPDLNLLPEISDRFSLGWMWRHRHEVDVLHLQWTELLYNYPGLFRSLKRWLSVMGAVVLARLSGVRIVCTVHNIWQHEGQRAGLVALGNRVLFALAHAVHVHDDETRTVLVEKWGRRGPIAIIAHGNYDTYPNECDRVEARQRLGIAPEAFVYLFVGRVRPYKGVADLIAAFRRLPAPDAVLWVAGEVHDPGYERELIAAAGNDGRIRLRFEYVPDDELQVVLNACDLCVLPYRHVTTSGAAFLSFSFGTPIIAPSRGCFVSLIGHPPMRGLVYEPDEANDGLLGALVRAREADLGAMRVACRRYAASRDWEHIARQHAAVYRNRVKEYET